AGLAAAALAACSGNSALPLANSANLAPDAVPHTACAQPANTFSFGGSCVQVALTNQDVSITLPKYRGFTVIAGFPKPKQVAANTPLGVADANGRKGDISPIGSKTFEKFRGYGKTFLYIKVYNGGSKVVKYFVNPRLEIRSTLALPGKTCTFG